MLQLAGLLLPLFLAAPDEGLLYRAPDSADPEDLPKVVAALNARFKTHGYKGVQVAVIDKDCRKVVKITCDSGRTPEMRRTIDVLTALSGSAVELRFPVTLTDAGREQYQPGPSPCDDTSPPGASWFRFWNPEQTPVLLREIPKVTRSELQMRTVKEKSGSLRFYWDLSAMQTREIREVEKKGRLGTPYLVMDGLVVEAVPLITLERNDEGKIVQAQKMSFSPVSTLAQEALANPMPFALSVEEAGEQR